MCDDSFECFIPPYFPWRLFAEFNVANDSSARGAAFLNFGNGKEYGASEPDTVFVLAFKRYYLLRESLTLPYDQKLFEDRGDWI